MRRRSFIRLTGSATLGIAAAGCAGITEHDQRALARPDLLDALGADRVRAIGARYRATHADESDADALRDAILASRPLGDRLFGSRSLSLVKLVHDDFEHGRTVVVDGWILSATEARQCALFSLVGA